MTARRSPPDDVVWSLERAGKEETGNPIQFVWKKIGNFKVDGNKITGDVMQFEPTLFKWMSFLTGYVLPKAYYEKVGAEGFETAPIGTGPYMVDKFEQNAFVRLKANPNYWGGKPAFDNVDHQVRAGRGEPRRRDRIRQLAGHARHPLRGIRPADRQGRACRLGHHRLRHRHDLPQRRRADDRQERAAGGGHVDRQEAADRPAAARLRRADRHAGDAGIRGLRSVDQGRVQPGKGDRAAEGVAASRPTIR